MREIIAEILPEFVPAFEFEQNNPYHIYTVWKHSLVALDNCMSSELSVRLAALFHDIGKPDAYVIGADGVGHFYHHADYSVKITERIMRRLRFDNNTIAEVTELVRYHDAKIMPTFKSVRRWLNRIGETQLRRLLIIQKADILAHSPGCLSRLDGFPEIEKIISRVIAEQQCFSLKDLAVKGRDLLEIGYTSGPLVGQALNYLLSEVIEGNFPNDREILLDAIKKRFDTSDAENTSHDY